MSFRTIQIREEEGVCHLQLYRPDAGNTINADLLRECHDALTSWEDSARVVVVEGLPQVFCLGADFQEVRRLAAEGPSAGVTAGTLYGLWKRLATGPYITIAHVRGKANAGGLGFVAACDIVLASDTAEFSLTEMMFGLLPACVLPFLARRVGVQRAQYLTFSTHAIPAQQACEWGLVDACDRQSNDLVRRHLLRLRRISKPAIVRLKRYIGEMHRAIEQLEPAAVSLNHDVFSDASNIRGITRYLDTGLFPWEKEDDVEPR